MEEGKRILATQLLDDNSHGNCSFFCENHLVAIELWKPKSNYHIPLFHTSHGRFTVPTTLHECSVGLPTFCNLDGSNLVNITQVDKIVTGDYGGGQVIFKNQDIKESINSANLSRWKQIYENAMNADREIRYIFGSEIKVVGKAAVSGFFKVGNMLSVDMWEPKKNYYVPRFHSGDRSYTIGLTAQACREAFPYLYPAYKDTLINLELVCEIECNAFGGLVRFAGSDFTCSMSHNKLKALKKLWN
ncbi:hypothetical protein [Paenibacillus ottowii]|uniref:Uncharacterized protein n=1 Tax=Paenibacillus ottowii TaxID=2315729 RepID=A0ABY3AZ93_9BACL|nr:hypothetical protein [Paenibacillus ottowii]TQR96708.1 hypothetical protein FKV70_22190 [Paenibacillus ottowii]